MDPDPLLSTRWSAWHDRLHRTLRQNPQLLPSGERVIVAVSGGQDSMALTGLLLGLRRLHHWNLHVWHGDHGWHPGSAGIASDLEHWCEQQKLPITISRASPPAGPGNNTKTTEAMARDWRYAALTQCARKLHHGDPPIPCQRVVCAHTATDKAETLLLHLARGSDLSGLGSLRQMRHLTAGQQPELLLVRPLLGFSRSDTATICQELQLPIWMDPSNTNLRFSRNRIRHQVLPVLNELHPGCEERMAAVSERLSHVRDTQHVLLDLSLDSLKNDNGLNRSRIAALPMAVRRSLLAHWLNSHGIKAINAPLLEELTHATAPGAPAGGRDLSGGWRIHWNRKSLQLEQKP
ncbi:MAG: tRNA lysidine(34) synthetase TilS [Synechococcus sp.]|nr:tRNA lysidine(34) synthetase TilS [Synechococcus sp.]